MHLLVHDDFRVEKRQGEWVSTLYNLSIIIPSLPPFSERVTSKVDMYVVNSSTFHLNPNCILSPNLSSLDIVERTINCAIPA